MESCIAAWCTSVRGSSATASLPAPRKLMLSIFPPVEALESGDILSSLEASGVTIQPAAVVKSLRVLTVQRLSFDQHIDKICKTCYHHIRTFRHLRESLPDDVARTVACSIVASRIDYCNSPFIGMLYCNGGVPSTCSKCNNLISRLEHCALLIKTYSLKTALGLLLPNVLFDILFL
jgi:hypothetical protein